MGKKGGRRGKRNRNDPTNSGWKKNPDGTDLVIERKNDLFESFYRAQNIVANEEDWEAFIGTLRRDLPQAFRLVGCRQEAEILLNVMKERYFSKLSDVVIDGKSVESPLQLPWYPDGFGFQLPMARQVLRKHPLLNNMHNFLVTESELGNLSRQEAVSMIPPLLLDVKSDSKVFDMCAAPGSKTAQLIEKLHGDDWDQIPSGFVLANDENNKRCYLLVHQSLKRLNSPCCLVVNNDASILPYPRILRTGDTWQFLQFDQILCDVPCSGDGTLRKNVGIWRNWQPYHGYNMHRLQTRIAKRGLEMLSVGGLMVYSTCSLNPAENEAVIVHLLDFAKGSVELVDVSDKLPGLKRSPGLRTWTIMDKEKNIFDCFSSIPESKKRFFPETIFPPNDSCAEKMHLERCIRILPHQQDTGAFFVALLKKTTDFPWSKTTTSTKQTPLNLDDLVWLTGNANETSSPARKRKKYTGFKEDPFVFLSDEDPYWKAVQRYFGVTPDFPNKQLLSRGYDETKKRNLYFVNDALKQIIESNGDRLKLINAGLRLFSKIDLKGDDTQIRLTQDGLTVLLPYIRKRIAFVTREEMIKILTTADRPSFPFAELNEETKICCEDWSEGSVILKCSHNERIVAICAWRGKTSLAAYLAKESTVHVLRMLDYDTTQFENDMINAKRQKKNKNGAETKPLNETDEAAADEKQIRNNDVKPKNTENR